MRADVLDLATTSCLRPGIAGFGRPWQAYAQIMTPDLAGSGSAALTRGLLRSGVAAGPLFVTVFLAEGARRADYRPSRHPVSSLSLGPDGWVQAANFSAAGALCVAGAAGLSRSRDAITGTRLVPALIGAAGLGLLASAVFPTDPVGGYPPGTPDVPPGQSASRIRHGIAAIPIFFGLPAAALACAWRFGRAGQPRWALYCAATAASTIANLGLAGAGFNQAPGLASRAGLFQRASIITAFAWITVVSARAIGMSTPD
jgi:Protein of unknown function (DUF998)